MKFFHHPDYFAPPEASVELPPSDAEIPLDALLLLPERGLHAFYRNIRPCYFALRPEMPKIGVSKCIIGENCRYDGGNKKYDISETVRGLELVGICPEQFGGLPTPREPASLRAVDGIIKVFTNSTQRDVTAEYELGAAKSLELLQKENVVAAVLKKRSPSCGCGDVWGVTARLLKYNGFCLIESQE